MLRLGIDVDGVVADFRSAFRELAARELGLAAGEVERDLAKEDVERLWGKVAAAPNWWLDLAAYEPEQVRRLYRRARQARWEVFFLTSRPPSAGDTVQLQTQVWLERLGFYLPSVLTAPAGARGELARALRLDVALDDRLVNCVEIVGASGSKALWIERGTPDAATRAGAESRGIGVVGSLVDAIDAFERLEDILPKRRGRLLRLSDWFRPKTSESPLPEDPRQRPPEA